MIAAIAEAKLAVDVASRAAPSPTAMAVVSSATTMDSITTAGSLVWVLELNDARIIAADGGDYRGYVRCVMQTLSCA